MASLTINPPAAKKLKTSATNNNNTSSTIKTISLVPFIDDFINTLYDKLSSNNGINGELTPENKKDVLERIEAIIHYKLTQQNKRCIKTAAIKRDFSKLPGIDDICVKTIIPYLGNDGQALMNMFGKTTKRFLTVPTIRDAYNSNISNCYEKILNRLNNRYETEFPEGMPLVCACEEGRFEDVKFIICLHTYIYIPYIHCVDVKRFYLCCISIYIIIYSTIILCIQDMHFENFLPLLLDFNLFLT
jgi:hypothetical protein